MSHAYLEQQLLPSLAASEDHAGVAGLGRRLARWWRHVNATLGPASGLTPLWPSNSAFSVNLNGSYKLPSRSRGTGPPFRRV